LIIGLIGIGLIIGWIGISLIVGLIRIDLIISLIGIGLIVGLIGIGLIVVWKYSRQKITVARLFCSIFFLQQRNNNLNFVAF
jgi:hypothetical protein